MLVESIMTRSVITTEPTDTVQSALQVMRKNRFRHLPVVRHGRVVGIVSDRDLVNPDSRTVGEVTRSQLISVTPDTPVEVAAELMLQNKIGALPVLEGGGAALVGIVTQSDLFAMLARLLGADQPSTRLELRLDDVPRQLAQIASLAMERGVEITSLVTLPRLDSDGSSRRIVLRIGTIAAGPFVHALEREGIALADQRPADA